MVGHYSLYAVCCTSIREHTHNQIVCVLAYVSATNDHMCPVDIDHGWLIVTRHAWFIITNHAWPTNANHAWLVITCVAHD